MVESYRLRKMERGYYDGLSPESGSAEGTGSQWTGPYSNMVIREVNSVVTIQHIC